MNRREFVGLFSKGMVSFMWFPWTCDGPNGPKESNPPNTYITKQETATKVAIKLKEQMMIIARKHKVLEAYQWNRKNKEEITEFILRDNDMNAEDKELMIDEIFSGLEIGNYIYFGSDGVIEVATKREFEPLWFGSML